MRRRKLAGVAIASMLALVLVTGCFLLRYWATADAWHFQDAECLSFVKAYILDYYEAKHSWPSDLSEVAPYLAHKPPFQDGTAANKDFATLFARCSPTLDSVVVKNGSFSGRIVFHHQDGGYEEVELATPR